MSGPARPALERIAKGCWPLERRQKLAGRLGELSLAGGWRCPVSAPRPPSVAVPGRSGSCRPPAAAQGRLSPAAAQPRVQGVRPCRLPLELLGRNSESGVRQQEDTYPQPFSSRIDVSATLSPSLCVSRFALPLSSAPIDHPSSAVLKVSLGFQSRNRPRRSFKLVPRFSLWDHPSMTQPYFRSLVQQAGPLLIFKLWA